jgi:hypothetical protein
MLDRIRLMLDRNRFIFGQDPAHVGQEPALVGQDPAYVGQDPAHVGLDPAYVRQDPSYSIQMNRSGCGPFRIQILPNIRDRPKVNASGADPGPVPFATPGSGIRDGKNPDSASGVNILNHIFEGLVKSVWVKNI